MRAPAPAPRRCPTRKRIYATRGEAETFIAVIRKSTRRRDPARVIPQRAYECPKCGGWHLTALPLAEVKTK